MSINKKTNRKHKLLKLGKTKKNLSFKIYLQYTTIMEDFLQLLGTKTSHKTPKIRF